MLGENVKHSSTWRFGLSVTVFLGGCFVARQNAGVDRGRDDDSPDILLFRVHMKVYRSSPPTGFKRHWHSNPLARILLKLMLNLCACRNFGCR